MSWRSMCNCDRFLLCEFLFLSIWPSRVIFVSWFAKMSFEKSCEISAPHKTILMFIVKFFRTWSMQVSSSIKLMLSVNSSNEATMEKMWCFIAQEAFVFIDITRCAIKIHAKLISFRCLSCGDLTEQLAGSRPLSSDHYSRPHKTRTWSSLFCLFAQQKTLISSW